MTWRTSLQSGLIRRSDLIRSPSYRDNWPYDVMCSRNTVCYMSIKRSIKPRISRYCFIDAHRLRVLLNLTMGPFKSCLVKIYFWVVKLEEQERRSLLCFYAYYLIIDFSERRKEKPELFNSLSMFSSMLSKI